MCYIVARMIAVCFVCLGNICRSPTAEGVFQHVVREAGLAEHFAIDSAGTSAFGIGEPADPRSAETARGRGVELTSRGRQFEITDFDEFDYVVAVDRDNLEVLRALTRDAATLARISLLRDFDPDAPEGSDVPDPYYQDGFDDVFDLIEAACWGLLAHIREKHELGA